MRHLPIMIFVLLPFLFQGFITPKSKPVLACLDCHLELIQNHVVHMPASEGCDFCHISNGKEHPGSELAFHFESPVPDMCYICHETQNSMAQVHYPVAEGECTICHSPHSAEIKNLLIASYPDQNYTIPVVESFDLCFQCHDSELMTAESTDYATNFRNGNKNLHYTHLAEKRGRNCNLCHGLHGAPNMYILKDNVNFGKWEMSLGLKLSDNGGSCATGCHGIKEYNRAIE